jgi:putative ABC transport system ATP-binding protein
MISTSNLSKSFTTNGDKVIIYNNLNWSVKEGSSIAIMGPSGSGKSTLLNMISGLDVPNKGDLVVWSTRVSSLSEDERTLWRSKNIAFIFQSFHLIPNLTIKDNIDLVIDIAQIERRFTTGEILNKVWLSGYENRYPHQLSGWEQQRVAIARAFVGKQPILLADEPTGNLDHKNAYIIMDLMMGLHKESGTTVIIITHDPVVANYAQQQFELIDGELHPTL